MQVFFVLFMTSNTSDTSESHPHNAIITAHILSLPFVWIYHLTVNCIYPSMHTLKTCSFSLLNFNALKTKLKSLLKF